MSWVIENVLQIHHCAVMQIGPESKDTDQRRWIKSGLSKALLPQVCSVTNHFEWIRWIEGADLPEITEQLLNAELGKPLARCRRRREVDLAAGPKWTVMTLDTSGEFEDPAAKLGARIAVVDGRD